MEDVIVVLLVAGAVAYAAFWAGACLALGIRAFRKSEVP